MPPSPPPPRPLTDRDHELLRFAAEQRFVLAAQVARLLDVSADSARRRLVRLREAGLMTRSEPFSHETPAYRVNRRGLTVVDSRLSAPRPVDLGTYAHDVGVGWLHAAAERGAFGELSEIVSERRMRSEDRRADRDPQTPVHGVRSGAGRQGGPRLHYPDLVLVDAGGRRIALELELSHKQPARRERILSAYASDRRIDAVVYLVPNAATARAIERAAARTGTRDLVRVQQFRWAGGRAPTEAPAERTRVRAGAGRAAGSERATGAGREAER